MTKNVLHAGTRGGWAWCNPLKAVPSVLALVLLVASLLRLSQLRSPKAAAQSASQSAAN
jgi:hypothetical protein